MKINVRSVLFIIFFLSGVSGLIYESIWTHYLKLFLGHAAYAQTLVLAIFMGGMALGAWLCSRFSRRWINVLAGYALAEGLIGLAAIGFHPLFENVMFWSFDTVVPWLGRPFPILFFKWGMATLLILPQSILLGMTFPLMSAGMIRRYPEQSGLTLAQLYFCNSLGGALGVLLSGFVTIKWIGLPGTIELAGVLNISLALLVGGISRGMAKAGPANEQRSMENLQFYRLLLVVAFGTGAASFIYEIGWIRMLSLVLGSSTHAFELMLSAFIFGLACGCFWIRRRIDAMAEPVRFLAFVQLLMGSLALATLPIYGQTFTLMQWLLQVLEKDSGAYLAFNLGSHAIALLIMLPASACAGTTLPLITHMLYKQGRDEQSIGAVYSTNTLGSICGLLFAVHLGFTWLGLKGLLIAGAAVDMTLGVCLLLNSGGSLRIRTLPALSALLLLVFVAVWVQLDYHKMASGVYRHGGLITETTHSILGYRDGKTASISLTSTPGDFVTLRTNGKADVGINRGAGPASYDEVTMTMLAILPQLLAPGAGHVANIGLGSGITGHMVMANPAIRQLDSIEIEAEMVTMARTLRPLNERVFADSRSHIHVEDAKTFFSARQQRYDVIISVPSNPWVSGVAGLFSIEFYRDIRRYLKTDGILVQWIQLYEIEPALVATIIKAVGSEFTDYSIFAGTHADLIVVASAIPLDLSRLNSSWSTLPHAELKRIDVNGPADIWVRWLGNKSQLETYFSGFNKPANSDYYPVLDQYAAEARFMGTNASELLFPLLQALPFRQLLSGMELAESYLQVTPTALFTPAFGAYVAGYVRDRLLGKPVQYSSAFDIEGLRSELIKADRILQECQKLPAHGDKVYQLYQLASLTLPYLPPADVEGLWLSLAGLECVDSLNPYEQRWLTLFQAIGKRDAMAMTSLSEKLLKQPQWLTETRGRYLVATGTLGNLVLGQDDNARSFWARYRHLLPADQSQYSSLFRWFRLRLGVPNAAL